MAKLPQESADHPANYNCELNLPDHRRMSAGCVLKGCSIGGWPSDFCRIRAPDHRTVIRRSILAYCDEALSQPSSSTSHVLISLPSAPVSMCDPLYVVMHDVIPNPPDVVIARAHSRIGEMAYDLATNNCESFANWSKIGINKSLQAETGIGIFAGLGALAVLGAVLGTVLAPKRG